MTLIEANIIKIVLQPNNRQYAAMLASRPEDIIRGFLRFIYSWVNSYPE
jgi:hypothetical protein